MVLIYLVIVTVIDPYRQFGGNWFPNTRVASRADKLRLFTWFRMRGAVTGLILGSSRSMRLAPREFDRATNKRFFNAGVFNAFAEDNLALYRVLVERGANVQALVVGMDDDELTDSRPFDDELQANYTLRSEVDGSIGGAAGFVRHRVRLYKSSLSATVAGDLFQSARMLIRPLSPLFTFAPDGSMVYVKPEERDFVGHGYIPRLRSMGRLSSRRNGFLETLIRTALSNGAKVILFTTPYRPAALAEIRHDESAWKNHKMAVDYLLSLQPKYGIVVRDYSDETAFGGDPGDWEDAVHYGGENAARLARQIIQDGF